MEFHRNFQRNYSVRDGFASPSLLQDPFCGEAFETFKKALELFKGNFTEGMKKMQKSEYPVATVIMYWGNYGIPKLQKENKLKLLVKHYNWMVSHTTNPNSIHFDFCCFGVGFCLQKQIFTAYGNSNDRVALIHLQKCSKIPHFSCHLIGLCYQFGKDITNTIKAVQYFQEASDQGNAHAQWNLANCYENGDGVSKNMSTALYYYQLSANQGNPRAQCTLGYLYETGKGVVKNLQKAYEFYQQAGDQGYSIAHYNLGNCFYWGNGVSKNLATARYYYLLAAQEGDKDAEDMLLRLPRDETKTAFY